MIFCNTVFPYTFGMFSSSVSYIRFPPVCGIFLRKIAHDSVPKLFRVYGRQRDRETVRFGAFAHIDAIPVFRHIKTADMVANNFSIEMLMNRYQFMKSVCIRILYAVFINVFRWNLSYMK